MEGDVPDAVKTFLLNLTRQLSSRNVYELQSLYDDFSDLSDRYFKSTNWPDSAKIAQNLGSKHALILYKELSLRSRQKPTLADKTEAFQNYIALFDAFIALNAQTPELELPSLWLWDIIDEFLNQYQEFHNYRSSDSLTAEEAKALQSAQIWSTAAVVRSLLALAKLGGAQPGKAFQEVDEPERGVPFFRILAQFALIGLSRVYALLGDFTSALRALAPIDVRSKRNAYSTVLSAHASLYLHMGLAYLMSRRYVDCAKTLSSFLHHFGRAKAAPAAAAAKAEQMYSLLALATAFKPERLDEFLQNGLRERFGERFEKLQKLEFATAEEFFVAGTPKFIGQDAGSRHLRLFRAEVEQRASFPRIYGLLRMATAVSTDKLSQFLGQDSDAVSAQLLSLKNKTLNMRWKSGAVCSGVIESQGEVEFYVDKAVIHVAKFDPPRRYAEYFVRQILRLEDLVEDVKHSGGKQQKTPSFGLDL